MKNIYKLILALILFTTSAFAQPVIPIRVIVVENPHTSVNDQLKMFKSGLDLFLSLKDRYYKLPHGLKFKVSKPVILKDVLRDNNLDRYSKRLFNWGGYAISNGIIKKDGVLTFFLLPPVEDNGVQYQGGVASSICDINKSKTPIAYAIVRKTNQAGLPRELISATTVAHEIGHLLGAEHIDLVGTPRGLEAQVNIMHPNAGVFGNMKIPWLKWLTASDVYDCLKGRQLKTRGSISPPYDPPFL